LRLKKHLPLDIGPMSASAEDSLDAFLAAFTVVMVVIFFHYTLLFDFSSGTSLFSR
jgi:preprotein translocase subunit SecG